jgi:hypothetical protein
MSLDDETEHVPPFKQLSRVQSGRAGEVGTEVVTGTVVGAIEVVEDTEVMGSMEVVGS